MLRQSVRISPEGVACRQQPLRFRSRRSCAAVRLSKRGNVVSSHVSGVSSHATATTDICMSSRKGALIWKAKLLIEEISSPDMCIGVISRNYTEGPLASSKHAVVIRCGDGSITHKGLATNLSLRPIQAGDMLCLTMDMQTHELTFELLERGESILMVTIENIMSDVTFVVGFAASGQEGRVRITDCTSEKSQYPASPLRKSMSRDLWDDDNVQTPLHQRPTYKDLLSHISRVPLKCKVQEASVASTLC